jgi:hypothetical protein
MAFNENDPVHRRYYYDFVVNGTWGACPVRFMAESLNTDLVSHINQKMLMYYVKQEFKNVRKKTTAKKSPA